MSNSLFPMVQPEMEPEDTQTLPMYRDVAWDCNSGKPIYSGGRPVMVEGAEAIRGWCWRALNTVRCRHDIYTWDYGNEVENLIGQRFSSEVKEAEAIRYIREALVVNPYIVSVEQVDVTFTGSKLTIYCEVETIYGEVFLHV